MQAQLESRPFGFLDTHVLVHVRHDDGADGISVLESRAPHGDSPPLHVHRTEDESFYLLEGELRLRIGDDELVLLAGDCTLAPRGVPHTYRVESEEGARWLVVTTHGDFERFVLDLARPLDDASAPRRSASPSAAEAAALAEAAAAHGIELVGPPLG